MRPGGASIYHQDWTIERRAEKFGRALSLAWALPNSRRRVTLDLRARSHGSRKALAAAFRLIDIAGLRIGSREYARENGTYGLTTLEDRHAHVLGSQLRLRLLGKGGTQWNLSVDDPDLACALSPMLKQHDEAALLAYPNARSLRRGSAVQEGWQQLSATSVNEYVRDIAGEDFSAKDLRTWRARSSLRRSCRGPRRGGRPRGFDGRSCERQSKAPRTSSQTLRP